MSDFECCGDCPGAEQCGCWCHRVDGILVVLGEALSANAIGTFSHWTVEEEGGIVTMRLDLREIDALPPEFNL